MNTSSCSTFKRVFQAVAVASFVATLSTHKTAYAASANSCEAIFSGSPSAFGFSSNAKVLQVVNAIVAHSKLREKPVTLDGFNNGIQNPDAKNLGKVVRQETPYTIKTLGRWMARQSENLTQFKQLGIILGDPHTGNIGSEMTLFSAGDRDRNTYTLTDLDEVTVGLMSMDLARYFVFLKATYGDLGKNVWRWVSK